MEWPDRPWAELRSGRLINEHWLAQQLRPYGIRPRPFWREGRQSRGYRREDFREITRRYISKSDLNALMPEPPPPSVPNLNRNPNPNLNPNSASEVRSVSPQRAVPDSPPDPNPNPPTPGDEPPPTM